MWRFPIQGVLASRTALDRPVYKVAIFPFYHLPSLSLFPFIFSCKSLTHCEGQIWLARGFVRRGFAPYLHLIDCSASSRLRVASSLSIPCVQMSFATCGIL